MSFLSELISGGAQGLVTGLGTFAKDLRAAITGQTVLDATAQAELLQKMAALQDAAEARRIDYEKAMAEGQIAINKLEAASNSLFVSGWRPAVGWVCVSGLFYTFLLKPIFPWLAAVVCNIIGVHPVVPLLPEVPMGDLIVLLTGMLGFGVMRTIEKKIEANGK